MNTKTSTKLINEATPALEHLLGIFRSSLPDATDHTLGMVCEPGTEVYSWYASFLDERGTTGMIGASPWEAMFHALSAYHNREV